MASTHADYRESYTFTLKGETDLLMHADDVLWADDVDEWRRDAKNTKKAGEKSGDDRRPAHTWVGYCYYNNAKMELATELAMPSANLTACLKKAGARVTLSGKKTFKELAVSAVVFDREFLKFTIDGKVVPWLPIYELLEEPNFRNHTKAVIDLGFDLFVKRAVVGMAKHVRVRPRFAAAPGDPKKGWEVTGRCTVEAHEITPEILESIFYQAGRVGLGDWRPGSPKSPGTFGKFDATLKKAK